MSCWYNDCGGDPEHFQDVKSETWVEPGIFHFIVLPGVNGNASITPLIGAVCQVSTTKEPSVSISNHQYSSEQQFGCESLEVNQKISSSSIAKAPGRSVSQHAGELKATEHVNFKLWKKSRGLSFSRSENSLFEFTESDCQGSVEVGNQILSQASEESLLSVGSNSCLNLNVSCNYRESNPVVESESIKDFCTDSFEFMSVTYDMEEPVVEVRSPMPALDAEPDVDYDPYYKCAFEFAKSRGFGFVEFVDDKVESLSPKRSTLRKKLPMFFKSKDDRVNPVSYRISGRKKFTGHRNKCKRNSIDSLNDSAYSELLCALQHFDESRKNGNNDVERVRPRSLISKSSCPELMKEHSPQRNRHRMHSKTVVPVPLSGSLRWHLESPEIPVQREGVKQSSSLSDVSNRCCCKGEFRSLGSSFISRHPKPAGVGDVLNAPKEEVGKTTMNQFFCNKPCSHKLLESEPRELRHSEVNVNYPKSKVKREIQHKALDTNASRKDTSESCEKISQLSPRTHAKAAVSSSEERTILPKLRDKTSLEYKFYNSISAAIFRENHLVQETIQKKNYSEKMSSVNVDVVYYSDKNDDKNDSVWKNSSVFKRRRKCSGNTRSSLKTSSIKDTFTFGMSCGKKQEDALGSSRGCKLRKSKAESWPHAKLNSAEGIHGSQREKIFVSKSPTVVKQPHTEGDSKLLHAVGGSPTKFEIKCCNSLGCASTVTARSQEIDTHLKEGFKGLVCPASVPGARGHWKLHHNSGVSFDSQSDRSLATSLLCTGTCLKESFESTLRGVTLSAISRNSRSTSLEEITSSINNNQDATEIVSTFSRSGFCGDVAHFSDENNNSLMEASNTSEQDSSEVCGPKKACSKVSEVIDTHKLPSLLEHSLKFTAKRCQHTVSNAGITKSGRNLDHETCQEMAEMKAKSNVLYKVCELQEITGDVQTCQGTSEMEAKNSALHNVSGSQKIFGDVQNCKDIAEMEAKNNTLYKLQNSKPSYQTSQCLNKKHPEKLKTVTCRVEHSDQIMRLSDHSAEGCVNECRKWSSNAVVVNKSYVITERGKADNEVTAGHLPALSNCDGGKNVPINAETGCKIYSLEKTLNVSDIKLTKNQHCIDGQSFKGKQILKKPIFIGKKGTINTEVLSGKIGFIPLPKISSLSPSFASRHCAQNDVRQSIGRKFEKDVSERSSGDLQISSKIEDINNNAEKLEDSNNWQIVVEDYELLPTVAELGFSLSYCARLQCKIMNLYDLFYYWCIKHFAWHFCQAVARCRTQQMLESANFTGTCNFTEGDILWILLYRNFTQNGSDRQIKSWDTRRDKCSKCTYFEKRGISTGNRIELMKELCHCEQSNSETRINIQMCFNPTVVRCCACNGHVNILSEFTKQSKEHSEGDQATTPLFMSKPPVLYRKLHYGELHEEMECYVIQRLFEVCESLMPYRMLLSIDLLEIKNLLLHRSLGIVNADLDYFPFQVQKCERSHWQSSTISNTNWQHSLGIFCKDIYIKNVGVVINRYFIPVVSEIYLDGCLCQNLSGNMNNCGPKIMTLTKPVGIEFISSCNMEEKTFQKWIQATKICLSKKDVDKCFIDAASRKIIPHTTFFPSWVKAGVPLCDWTLIMSLSIKKMHAPNFHLLMKESYDNDDTSEILEPVQFPTISFCEIIDDTVQDDVHLWEREAGRCYCCKCAPILRSLTFVMRLHHKEMFHLQYPGSLLCTNNNNTVKSHKRTSVHRTRAKTVRQSQKQRKAQVKSQGTRPKRTTYLAGSEGRMVLERQRPGTITYAITPKGYMSLCKTLRQECKEQQKHDRIFTAHCSHCGTSLHYTCNIVDHMVNNFRHLLTMCPEGKIQKLQTILERSISPLHSKMNPKSVENLRSYLRSGKDGMKSRKRKESTSFLIDEVVEDSSPPCSDNNAAECMDSASDSIKQDYTSVDLSVDSARSSDPPTEGPVVKVNMFRSGKGVDTMQRPESADESKPLCYTADKCMDSPPGAGKGDTSCVVSSFDGARGSGGGPAIKVDKFKVGESKAVDSVILARERLGRSKQCKKYEPNRSKNACCLENLDETDQDGDDGGEDDDDDDDDEDDNDDDNMADDVEQNNEVLFNVDEKTVSASATSREDPDLYKDLTSVVQKPGSGKQNTRNYLRPSRLAGVTNLNASGDCTVGKNLNESGNCTAGDTENLYNSQFTDSLGEIKFPTNLNYVTWHDTYLMQSEIADFIGNRNEASHNSAGITGYGSEFSHNGAGITGYISELSSKKPHRIFNSPGVTTEWVCYNQKQLDRVVCVCKNSNGQTIYVEGTINWQMDDVEEVNAVQLPRNARKHVAFSHSSVSQGNCHSGNFVVHSEKKYGTADKPVKGPASGMSLHNSCHSLTSSSSSCLSNCSTCIQEATEAKAAVLVDCLARELEDRQVDKIALGMACETTTHSDNLPTVFETSSQENESIFKMQSGSCHKELLFPDSGKVTPQEEKAVSRKRCSEVSLQKIAPPSKIMKYTPCYYVSEVSSTTEEDAASRNCNPRDSKSINSLHENCHEDTRGDNLNNELV